MVKDHSTINAMVGASSLKGIPLEVLAGWAESYHPINVSDDSEISSTGKPGYAIRFEKPVILNTEQLKREMQLAEEMERNYRN